MDTLKRRWAIDIGVQPPTSLKGAPRPRIQFLDSLRCVAVLLVVWGHIFLLGINDPATVSIWLPNVSGLAFGPETVQNNMHGQVGLYFALHTGVTPGALGVALFFLISGFVILQTLDRVRPFPFFIQRFFRIVPLCVLSVCFVGLYSWAYCTYYGLRQPNSICSILTSSFALNFYNGAFSTIPVLWTLEIEMVFYLIMGIACLIDFRMDFTRLLCISFVCGCTALLYFWLRNSYRGGHDWPNFRHISGMLVHVAYMLIGSLIYRAHCAERIAVALASIFAGVSLFVAAYGIYGLATDNMPIGTNLPSCATALLIFLAAMWSGMRSKYFFPLRWIASISYPLYLIHVPLAWAILYWMASFGAGMNVAAFTGAVIAIICAWCIHHAAELPLQKMGKAFSGHIGGG